jgi:thiol-disulfide isomerase/thioredoxin
MAKRGVFILVVLLAALLAACGSGSTAPVEEAPAGDDMVERPSEPAGETFRSDSVTHIAATGNPQLIEFFAYWCTTCARVRPIVHGLEAEYWDRVDFVYLDIDDPANREAMNEYGFTAQPYFVLIEADGTVVQTWFGYTEADTFRTGLDSVLQAGR